MSRQDDHPAIRQMAPDGIRCWNNWNRPGSQYKYGCPRFGAFCTEECPIKGGEAAVNHEETEVSM